MFERKTSDLEDSFTASCVRCGKSVAVKMLGGKMYNWYQFPSGWFGQQYEELGVMACSEWCAQAIIDKEDRLYRKAIQKARKRELKKKFPDKFDHRSIYEIMKADREKQEELDRMEREREGRDR